MYRNTGFGLGFRAFIENRELAQVQGINTDKIRVIIWTFAGGLAGLAGSIMVMRFHVTAMMGSYVMMAVIAAALLGGMKSHRGAVIGGLLVGLSDILLVSWGQRIIGVWFGEYRFLTSFSIIVIVLCLNPNGILGSDNPGYGRFNLRRV